MQEKYQSSCSSIVDLSPPTFQKNMKGHNDPRYLKWGEGRMSFPRFCGGPKHSGSPLNCLDGTGLT